MPDMTIDLDSATDFVLAHARVLDQRRFELLTGDGDPDAVLAALDGYRNADGGFGHGLEPDLRSPESQPAAALHAFEAIADVGPVTSTRSAELCDWLDARTLADGGLPFALPVTRRGACAPFWADADPASSSLQITAIVATQAWRVAAHDPAVGAHHWLARATEFCLRRIRALEECPHAIELAFAVQLLDVISAHRAEAGELLERVARFVPASGRLRVDGGADDEYMRPLDFAPHPGPARTLFADAVVAEDLRRHADGQCGDGGWEVDFASFSPAAALEWRGYRTVATVSLLHER